MKKTNAVTGDRLNDFVPFLAIFVSTLIAVFWALSPRQERLSEVEVLRLVQRAAARHGVEPELVLAVIRQESKFNVRAIGDAGEIGLMQITRGVVLDWQRRFKQALTYPRDLFVPEINIEVGTWYLSRGLDEFHREKARKIFALAYYNAGPGRVRRWVKEIRGKLPDSIPIPSTRRYIKNVLRYYEEYKIKYAGDMSRNSFRQNRTHPNNAQHSGKQGKTR
ncbi:MAG: lytic transglycosylase domain-containing protein [Lentisphaerae bacterium]|nr:MAG: lytic transglycosylase domain-containing protein [Lentisphaerota bacterium]